MIAMNKLAVLGVSLLSVFLSAAQRGPLVIRLTVNRDGQQLRAPNDVTVSIGVRSMKIILHDGEFEIPPDVADADNVTFATDIGPEHIRVEGLSGRKFKAENWTLLLANHRFDKQYEEYVPKQAAVRLSCILAFDSAHGDPGTVAFVTNCRSKRK